jgi:hypothetical protein
LNERTKSPPYKAIGLLDQFVHSKIQPSDRKLLQPKVAPSYADPMGDRRKARSRIRNARAKERWALALVLVITCVPLLATLFAIVSTTEPDLSDFTPINPRVGNYLLLNWSELREGHLLTPSSVPTEYTDALVQVLGYMTEGDGPTLTGELIRDFGLLPEVGDALHPAHGSETRWWPSTFEKGIKSSTRPRLL